MRAKYLIIVALIVGASSALFADAGESAFTFLRIAPGSRPAALAEAVTASGQDVTSAFYNPALLRSIESRNQVAFMYNAYFVDVSQNYLGFATKGKKSALGGYMVLGGVPDIERRDSPSDNPSGQFDESYFSGTFSYAYSFDRFDLGVNLRYSYEKLDYESASSVMFDAGAAFNIADNLSGGAAVKNIGTDPKFINQSYPLSEEYRIGLAYKPENFDRNLAFLGDAVFYSDLQPKYNFGVEYATPNYITLRIGYGAGYDSRGLSFGGGLNYRQFRFDYAFVSYANDLGNAHRFTLMANF